MTIWKPIKLKDVCEKITVGHVGSMAAQYKPQGVPFLRSQNINPYKLSLDNLVYIDEVFNEKLKKSKLVPGDLAIVRTGYPGTAAVIPKSLPVCNCSDLVIIRPGPRVSAQYLCYTFNSVFGKNLVGGRLVGAAQQHFNITTAKELNLNLPPLLIQRKIAAVLSAYDDLIENNTRRIAILEKMAEELYREWFVRLRFPGHEKTKIVKGMPEGWEITKIREVFKTTSGGTPSRQKETEYYGGAINWIKTGELKDSFVLSTEEKITEAGLSSSSAKVFPPNTLLMAMYGVNIGQLGIATQPSATNQACCAFLPKKLSEYSMYYLFHFLKSIRFHLFNISMGAAQQNLSQDLIQRLDYLKPASTLLISFDEIQNSIFSQEMKLLKVNDGLIASRDRLLSRLMSGKIDLEHLDIHFPPSMREEELVHA